MITVSGTSLVWPLGSGTYYVKVYATEPFRASDGTFVVGGKTGTDNTAIPAVLCSFVSASPATGTLTVPSISLYATDTSRDRPDVRYNAVIYDSDGDYVQDLLLNFYVPAATPTTTWAELEGLVSNPDPPIISSITPTKLTATLVWSAPSSLYAIAGYEVRFNGSVTDVGNVLTYQKTGLTASTNYTFEVRARDVLNHLSPWSEVEDARTLANDVPTTPVLNAANVLDYTVIAISWSAATDTDGTVSGYHYRLNGGSHVDVGNYLEQEIIGLTPNTAYSIQVRAYDNLGATGSWSNTVIGTTASAANPIIVGHGDSMMFGSGNEATVPETDNPSIQTKNLLTGATWQHTNVGHPGARMAHGSGLSPDDLLAGGVAVVDPIYSAGALHNILLTNGGINDVPFVPGPVVLATTYPWILQRLKTLYIEYGLARRTTGWGNDLGPIISPMPVCDFPNTPSDYGTYLRAPINTWFAANFWQFAADYANWTGNANIGDGANTANATYFDVSDPDSGGTTDRLHLTTAGYAIEAQYFRDAVERMTKDTSAPVGPTAVSVTALNCEQIRVNYTNSVDANLHHYEIRVTGGVYTDQIIDIGRDNPYVLKNLAGSTAYEIEIRSTDVAGHHSPWSSVYTATTTAGTFARLYAIDCGRVAGGTVAGWGQDALFTNGVAYTGWAAYTARTFLVDDPATNAVYQTARISDSVLPVTYTFPSVNTSRHHRVRMHFVMGNITHIAEPVAQQWYMDIAVNSVLIEDNFDLAMEIGVGTVVYILEYEVAAGPSSVVVELTQVVPGVAQIVAIELYGVAP
jgi:chitodextrinase